MHIVFNCLFGNFSAAELRDQLLGYQAAIRVPHSAPPKNSACRSLQSSSAKSSLTGCSEVEGTVPKPSLLTALKHFEVRDRFFGLRCPGICEVAAF